MKKIILLYLLMLMPLVASAQTKRTIHVATAGTLSNYISNEEKYQIEELTLTGELNGTDIYFIRQMAGIDYSVKENHYNGGVGYYETDGVLTSLDMSNARIIQGGNAYMATDDRFGVSVTYTEIDWYYYYTQDNCISTLMFYRTQLENIILPNSITSIGGAAFYGCGQLTSIKIPKSVNSIGISESWTAPGICLFSGCTNLSSIEVDDGNTVYDSRDGCNAIISTDDNTIIAGCKNTKIPNSVTRIGEKAFSFCSGLTSIIIPTSVINIGNDAFYGCSSLSSVYISDLGAWCNISFGNDYSNPLTQAHHLFLNGTEVKDFVIPNSVTSIGNYAFSGCSGLTSVNIPSSVTSIGADAFYSCSGLTSVTIGNNVTSIGENAFGWCSSLTSVTIPNSVKTIGERTFSGCSSLTSVTIPNSVKTIGESAFRGCTRLTSITIGNNVTSIGSSAFYGCTGLTSVTIGNNVTSIGSSAFHECSGLTTIVSEVENPFVINDNVFYCPNKSIYTTATLLVPPGKKSAYQSTAGWNKFTNIVESGQGNIIGQIFEYNGIRYKICENNTASVTSTENLFGDVVIQKQVTYNGVVYTVTSIEDYACCMGREDYSMTSITIPNTITSIGVEAFADREGLKAVYITDIEAWCNIIFHGSQSNPLFYANHLYLNNTEIKDLIIPNTITTINDYVFLGGSGFTSLTIPSSVTSIGRVAFSGCSGLTTIISEIKNPFAIEDIFPTSVYNNASLLVPSGKKSAYQNTAGWNKFQKIIESSVIGKEFESNGIRYLIGENNTVSVTSKTEKYAGAVSIPSQVYYDGNNYTVTAIAQSAFEGCVDMTSISIPGSVTTIGGAAFYYCTGLTTINISEGVTTIGEGAFSKCEGLISVTIPGSVTSIGKNAFFQCYGLTQITSWIENPFAIDNGVFPTSVYNNASLLVPSGKRSAYQNTAGWKRFQNIVEASAVGKEFEDNGIRYLIGENNTVSVISKTEKYVGAVVIPSQVTFNDDNYNITSIAQSAFEGCVDMTSISIPGSVTTIGDAAFYYCTGLTTVDIPNGVTTIGEGAFSKCEGLTSVTIPGSVTSIGKNAFFQCYGLTQITSGIENPFAIDNGVFPTSVYNNASLLVPSGKKSAYQNTAGWKRFQNIYYVDGVYTLTYYVDGVEYKSATYSYGAGIIPEAEPIREGYTFSGWNYIPETMPAEEVNVTGYFTINQYTITYVIDGVEYATETIDFGSKVDPPTPPSKEGFDFTWEEYPETMPAHDITINGVYTTTGILSIAVESGKAKIFTLNGRQVDTHQRGINIIRMDDGSIKKVVLGK